MVSLIDWKLVQRIFVLNSIKSNWWTDWNEDQTFDPHFGATGTIIQLLYAYYVTGDCMMANLRELINYSF